jgi:hypothetical protein
MKNIIIIISALLVMFGLSSCNRVSEEIIGPGNTGVDDQGFSVVNTNGFTLKYKVEGSDLHCKLSAATSGWVAVGFNPSAMMKDANFIIGYVSNNIANIRDDYGVSNTEHNADIAIGGTSNLTLIEGSEINGITLLDFKIPMNSGDPKDSVLNLNQSYPIIFAKGSADDYTSYHTAVAFSSITLGTPDPGGSDSTGVVPDTLGYHHVDTADYQFHWKIENDSIRCILSANTSGWVAVGFDPVIRMQGANFIIGYVSNNVVSIRDDYGVSQTAHSSDISLGGSENLSQKAGNESNGVTTISFTMPLNSGDTYDKALNPLNTYPVIFAKGDTDDFSSLHTGTSVINLNLAGTSVSQGITTGPDIALDNDLSGFQTESFDNVSFKWKVIGDSIRVHLVMPTSGWLAVGFRPTEEMLNANLIIGYVKDGVTYLRDDFGDSETTHASDLSLGGDNHVRRVYGRETGNTTEIHFTIPLNSGDAFDRIIVPGNEIKIIFAYGPNQSDNFNSMHAYEEERDILIN